MLDFHRLRYLLPIVMLLSGTVQSKPADLVLRGGDILTSDPRHPRARALAASGGRIEFVGDEADAGRWIGPSTRIIELRGRTVMPGLMDSHIHTALGEFLLHRLCDMRSFTTAEGYAKLGQCARTAPPGDWVIGYGWYFTDNPRIGEVSLAELDRRVPDRRLVVISKDLHSIWVNSRTLRDYGITRNTPDPAGGRIERDTRGEPTGLLRDAAHQAIMGDVLHKSSYSASTLDLYRTAVPYLNRLGITSLLDALADEDTDSAYRALDAEGLLSMNVSLAFGVQPENYRALIPRIAARRSKQSRHVRVDYVKVFADGNLEDNLANLLPQGKNAGTRGYYTQQQMDDLVSLAEANGLSVFVHAIGDGAVRQVLDAVAKARQSHPCPYCRHTITHLQWVDPADQPRFKELGVIANIQEGWISPRAFAGPPGYDYRRATELLPVGAGMAARMFPYADLHRAGATLSAGSDWFFTNENPWVDMQAGATSLDPGESGQHPMLPAQRLPLPVLLAARTSGAAFQLRIEQLSGSLAEGKHADFIIVDRNILTSPLSEVFRTHVLSTWFEGREVYAAPAAQIPVTPTAFGGAISRSAR